MEPKKEQGFLQKLFSPKNMSEGTPWKRLAMFAIPQILGNFAQQLYNTVDTIVVGNSRWGYTALAAVGSSFPVLMVLMALFVGVATGTGIMVAQFLKSSPNFFLRKNNIQKSINILEFFINISHDLVSENNFFSIDEEE